MSETISHHLPTEIIAAYAAGGLSPAFALVVAGHVSVCDDCRADLAAHETVGGVVLEDQPDAALAPGLKAAVLSMLDDPMPPEPAPIRRNGVYPAPIMAALHGRLPKWRALGGGVKQCVIGGAGGAVSRLLFIPPGQAVPNHGHNGLELTLVLQGGFSDTTGHYDVGDVEVADADLDHVPTADQGPPCIVLAATDAPLRFHTFLPRLLQPIFGI